MVRINGCPNMTSAVYCGRKARNQTNKNMKKQHLIEKFSGSFSKVYRIDCKIAHLDTKFYKF